MFPDLEFIKTTLNGLRSRIEQVEKQIENWVTSFVRTNRPNWAQNDPNALDYIKGRTHYEDNGKVVQLPSKFLPSPTANTVGAIKADSAKTTDIQPVRLGTDGKLYSSGIPVFTTSGIGSAYTANVPEITELVNGMLVVMIPHVASASIVPKLNINGLGAHSINRFRSSLSGSYQTGVELSANTPVLLMYSAGRWFSCNFTQPDAQDLFGTVPTSKGGTGASFLTEGSYLVGNGTGKVLLKTPSEVLADIGAIPAPTTAAVGQTIVVKAVDADGKPTEWEAADIASGGDGWTTIFERVYDAEEDIYPVIEITDFGEDYTEFEMYCCFDLVSNEGNGLSIYVNEIEKYINFTSGYVGTIAVRWSVKLIFGYAFLLGQLATGSGTGGSLNSYLREGSIFIGTEPITKIGYKCYGAKAGAGSTVKVRAR